MNAIAPDNAAQALLEQRCRFVQALCQDRSAADVASDASQALLDVLLCLRPLEEREIIASLAGWQRRLTPPGILVVVETLFEGVDRSLLRTALQQRFRNVSTFHQRPLTGSAFFTSRHASTRILPLAEPVRAAALYAVHIASNADIPALSGSFLETDGIATAPELARGMSVSASLPETGRTPDIHARRNAVALLERCVELDGALFQQHALNTRLRQQFDDAPVPSADGFVLPRARHAWMLAEDRSATLGFYDHRVDDAVLHEADAGAAFLDRHDLLGTQPDIAGAIAALNAIAGGTARPAPTVSVIVPVFGQLGYTLNCLDSLLRHDARRAFEIILVDDASPDQSGDLLMEVKAIRLIRQAENGGFIASCNAGATAAHGALIVFLNNDTRVVSGWLDALVDSFAIFPNAGLIGSKMLYPDGSLQEAGGIVWRDASCWNFGRNDDPNRPQYCYARQVDYVSGCSIMLKAALFHDLGGFDAAFMPAYCEDADLALRVRKAGHEVWYQPRSRVVHYEGRTSGTDLACGVKAYQRINGRKLFLRWRDSLASHGTNGEAAFWRRERQVSKRALVIDASAPTPSEDAGSVTAVATMQLFQSLGYKVHFVPQDNFLFQEGPCTDLMRIGIDVAYAPYESDMDSYLRRYGRSFDAIFVFRVTVLETILNLLRKYAPQAPILFHTMDLHFLRMERQAQQDGDASAMAEAVAMKLRELRLIQRVDCTITHSTFEAALLEEAAPGAPTMVWPFMFDFHGTEAGFDARRDICFLGGYRHAPNVDAVVFFATEVLPLIHLRRPDVRFIIAGANPTPEVLALAGPQVVVTGKIGDLREVFDQVKVFACSLRIGAGTKGKVSTAMAYGLPIVSTSCGAEGMELRDGADVLLADTPDAFAAACLRLYGDRGLWQALSDQGQALVQERHSRAMGRRVLDAAIETAWRHRLELDG